jgi:hypothetical protein
MNTFGILITCTLYSAAHHLTNNKIMKNGKGLITLIVATALIGCAPKMQLTKDVTQEQLGKDNAECNLEGMKATIGLSQSIFLEVERNKAINYCLQAKGYTYKQKPNDQQQSIADRYKQAANKYKEKMVPISEYIVNTCRPMDDKGYIDCIGGKKDESIAASMFPDITIKGYNARKELEQQLLRKEITRKEFKDEASKLETASLKEMDERISKRV